MPSTSAATPAQAGEDGRRSGWHQLRRKPRQLPQLSRRESASPSAPQRVSVRDPIRSGPSTSRVTWPPTANACGSLAWVDSFARECLALEVDTSMPSRRITRAMPHVIEGRGRLQAIRSDNGPEMSSRRYLAWCVEHKLTLAEAQVVYFYCKCNDHRY